MSKGITNSENYKMKRKHDDNNKDRKDKDNKDKKKKKEEMEMEEDKKTNIKKKLDNNSSPSIKEYDDIDLIPGLGTRQRFEDLFKKSKSSCLSSLSSSDIRKAEQEMKQFLGKNKSKDKDRQDNSTTTGNKSSKSKQNEIIKSKLKEKERIRRQNKKKKHKSSRINMNASFETNALLREVDEVLGGNTSVSLNIPSCSTNTGSNSKNLRKSRTTRSTSRVRESTIASTSSGQRIPVIEISISDSDSDNNATSSSNKRKSKTSPRKNQQRKETPRGRSNSSATTTVVTISDDEDVETVMDTVDLGSILLFQAELKSEKFPIRMYEQQYIRELRAFVAQKTKAPVEYLQMFLGDYLQLEDDKTLLESGIRNMCTVETYIMHVSEKDLYEQGSESVLKFKLQTDDRKGRGNAYVFVFRNGKMQSAIDQYANELGISASGMRLEFDGEILDLSSSPGDCDLEGGECLDLLQP